MTVPIPRDEPRALARWNHALARYREAAAAVEAVGGAGGDRLFDRLLGRHNRLLLRLLRTPAPHPAALADKLDLLVAHEVWELVFAEPALAALRRDARRLARSSRAVEGSLNLSGSSAVEMRPRPGAHL